MPPVQADYDLDLAVALSLSVNDTQGGRIQVGIARDVPRGTLVATLVSSWASTQVSIVANTIRHIYIHHLHSKTCEINSNIDILNPPHRRQRKFFSARVCRVALKKPKKTGGGR